MLLSVRFFRNRYPEIIHLHGARAAIDHLVDLGHRRIGLVNGPLSVRQAADRREGVLAAIVETGLDVAEVLEEVEVVVEGRAFRRRPPPNS